MVWGQSRSGQCGRTTGHDAHRAADCEACEGLSHASAPGLGWPDPLRTLSSLAHPVSPGPPHSMEVLVWFPVLHDGSGSVRKCIKITSGGNMALSELVSEVS